MSVFRSLTEFTCCDLVVGVCVAMPSRNSHVYSGTEPGGKASLTDYSSVEEKDAAVAEAQEGFCRQLTEHPYRPLVRDALTCFGGIQRVVLETHRAHDVNLPHGTILDPSRSFVCDEPAICI
ncbi:hypothetical protein V1527DRAFT_464366, partial [Lipomyces starkeyi]